ncbi:MAG: hypothetical protein AUH43_09570 [Acidobacteria bacterium 13_1_40CM_65_14]|nr:MAG: hypothetical protein AUH43_09570 [Acidobacteria bacterium 13_1_40CM_65_14]OLC81438.1 MAG: hypothetical protein AUH72_09515 [Acidobacteria bacterium 13_1_40CM_4_65_8]
MAPTSERQLEHLLRRAGFGARTDELDLYGQMSVDEIVDSLVEFQFLTDDVDSKIGKPGHVGTTTRGIFSPNSNITDARQRWLFRMVHSDRPLQEKMTLFWHNHFATGYTKIAGTFGATEGTRYMAAKASEDPGKVRGQIELFRDMALGNFRNLLTAVAKDTAMLVWLDGRTNTKAKPQENFAREIMELFTMGVGNYTEPDVYAGARVFSGWNLQRPGLATDGSQHYEFIYVPAQHDTASKTFSFAIYPDGNKTIPARGQNDGMQDGIDFINALAANPNTGRYLAAKLFRFFVSEFREPDRSFIDRIAGVYLNSKYDMKIVMREVFLSPEFWDPRSYWARYSWPVELVIRSLKDVGWAGFSVDSALTPLANMGQTLFDPPDVSGWDAGQSWFSSGAMLARMNFASTLAANQRFNLANTSKTFNKTPQSFLSYFMGQIATPPVDSSVASEWMTYLNANGAWSGSDAQLQSKASGLVHLIAGSPEYQLQ